MVESTSKIYSTPSFSDARRPSQRTTCAQAGTEALRRRASSPSTKAARQPPSDTLQNRNNRAYEGPIVAFGWASGSGRVARTLNASGPNQVVVLSTTACPRPPRSHVLGQNSPVTPQPRQSDNARPCRLVHRARAARRPPTRIELAIIAQMAEQQASVQLAAARLANDECICACECGCGCGCTCSEAP